MTNANQPLTTGPLPAKYNSLSELRDLVFHMERYAVGIKGGLYLPYDADFGDLAIQIMSCATQLKEFVTQKSHLIAPKDMY